MKKQAVLVALIAALLFIPFVGNVHLFDWDEINFAESAREMLITGNYSRVMIDFKPFWEKPPLFIWMQALSMKIFGVNEFAARFPNAICGIITITLIFSLGTLLFNTNLGAPPPLADSHLRSQAVRSKSSAGFAYAHGPTQKHASGLSASILGANSQLTFGALWALMYAGSFLPHFYFKSGIIDPWFNLFIFCSLVILFFGFKNSLPKIFLFSLSGIFAGLAVITKGPVAFLIIALAIFIYFFAGKFFSRSISTSVSFFNFKIIHLSIFLLFTILISFVWVLPEMLNHGTSLFHDFIQYQIRLLTTPDAGHGGPFFYHVLVLLFGCFPASIIAISGFFKKHNASEIQLHFRKLMIILFLTVLIIFSIVETKIVHYSSMCYLPLTFLAAWESHFLIQKKTSLFKVQIFAIITFGILTGIAAALFPILGTYPEILIKYISDPFARANLQAEVNWNFFMMIPGILYILIFIFAGSLMIKGKTARLFSKMGTGTIIICVATTIFIEVLMFAFVPRIERYSQGAAIDFYKSIQNEDAYVQVLNFKSYAHLFYAKKQPPENPLSYDTNWLLNGNIDKPVYFVTKIHRAQQYREMPQLQEIGEKNGFVFFKREAKLTSN